MLSYCTFEYLKFYCGKYNFNAQIIVQNITARQIRIVNDPAKYELLVLDFLPMFRITPQLNLSYLLNTYLNKGNIAESIISNVVVIDKNNNIRTPLFDNILKGCTVRKLLEFVEKLKELNLINDFI